MNYNNLFGYNYNVLPCVQISIYLSIGTVTPTREDYGQDDCASLEIKEDE